MGSCSTKHQSLLSRLWFARPHYPFGSLPLSHAGLHIIRKESGWNLTILPSHLEFFTLKFQSWSLRLVIWLRNGTRASGLLPCPHGCFQMIRTGLGNQRCRLTVFFCFWGWPSIGRRVASKARGSKESWGGINWQPPFLFKTVSKELQHCRTQQIKVFFSWLSKIPCDFVGDYPTARHQDQSGALRIDLLIGFLHPGRWNLLINHLETKMIFQASMIMFHVNLPGCILFLVHSIELYIWYFLLNRQKKYELIRTGDPYWSL